MKNPQEVMNNPKYSYMFEYRHNNKSVLYPISFGWECGKGWYNLIAELIDKIAELDNLKLVRVQQIKEKFGGLRFYISNGTDEIYKLIDEYEDKSYKTCEGCGAPSTKKTSGWICYLCNKCYELVQQGKHVYDDIKN